MSFLVPVRVTRVQSVPLTFTAPGAAFATLRDRSWGDAGARQVQAILGHKKLETTRLNTRVVVENLREVLEQANPGRRPPQVRRYNNF
jgi:hypothetical protein